MTPHRANAPRFLASTDHVESWFLRCNHPTEPRAVWIRATVLTRKDGSSLVQAWCTTYDGDRTRAFCTEVPLEECRFETAVRGTRLDLRIIAMDLGTDLVGSAGALVGDGSEVGWTLGLSRTRGLLGAPLSLLPSDRLIDGRLPRNKLLTPFPAAVCSGRLVLDGEVWDLDGWTGMQGHNWGSAHSPEYAWGQCLFHDGDRTVAMVEAASGRIRLGRRTSPVVSMLVVRHDDREHRFDRLLDLWRQRPGLTFPRWTLAMRGPAGRAELEMTARPERTACLDYPNPARATSCCLNSKTADVRLRVEPAEGAAFELHSPYGGALEFLGEQPAS